MAEYKYEIPKFEEKAFEHSPLDREWVVFHAYRGSVSHGTWRPDSDHNSIDDLDTMGIVIPSKSYYFGLKELGSRGTIEIKNGKWDIVMYEMRKAMYLLSQGNPNILPLLWTPKECILHQDECFKDIIAMRQSFLGKHLWSPFAGYASGQLHKMQNLAFEGYMGEKRKRLVEQFGYDTKNACACIRIMRMFIEIMQDGEVNVLRNDVDELLAIKDGCYSLEEIKKMAEDLFVKAKIAHEWSNLPDYPNKELINYLCREAVEKKFYFSGE